MLCCGISLEKSSTSWGWLWIGTRKKKLNTIWEFVLHFQLPSIGNNLDQRASVSDAKRTEAYEEAIPRSLPLYLYVF